MPGVEDHACATCKRNTQHVDKSKSQNNDKELGHSAAQGSAAEAAAAGAAAKRFMPFSVGPRQCLGQSLGRVMHDTAVARIVSSFRLELAPRMGGAAGVDAAAINRLTLQPGEGMWMRCHPRADVDANVARGG